MPLTGYTDKVRIKRLGKIRLGKKSISKRSGKEYPEALDHFNFIDAPAVEKVYGDNCRSLVPVYLPFNPEGRARDPLTGREAWNFDNCWQTSRSSYKSAGLFCRCDERTAIPDAEGELQYAARRGNKGLADKDGRHTKKGQPIDKQGWTYLKENELQVDVGDMFEMPCPGDECPYWTHSLCKPIGTLDLYLPNVMGRGIWTLQTGSFHSIRNIESVLQQLAEDMSGQVTGVPLVLNLKPQDAQVEGRKKVIFVLELICPLNVQQLAGLKRKALDTGSFTVLDALPPASEPIPDDLIPKGGEQLDAVQGDEVGMCPECHTAHKPSETCKSFAGKPVDEAVAEGEATGQIVDEDPMGLNEPADFFPDEPPADHPAEIADGSLAQAAAEGESRARKAKPEPEKPARQRRKARPDKPRAAATDLF